MGKRALIEELGKEYLKKMVCELVDCPRSAFYYQSAIHPEDIRVTETIEVIMLRWP